MKECEKEKEVGWREEIQEQIFAEVMVQGEATAVR
jgi:hypothetical protein